MVTKISNGAKWASSLLDDLAPSGTLGSGKREINVWKMYLREMRTARDPPQMMSAGSRHSKLALHNAKVRGQLTEYNFLVSELLRHFWACYPLTVTSATRLQKIFPRLKQYRLQVKEKVGTSNDQFSNFWKLQIPVEGVTATPTYSLSSPTSKSAAVTNANFALHSIFGVIREVLLAFLHAPGPRLSTENA